jgi:hypothetical protein
LPTKVFDEALDLSLGEAQLELRYHGINNIFIFL